MPPLAIALKHCTKTQGYGAGVEQRAFAMRIWVRRQGEPKRLLPPSESELGTSSTQRGGGGGGRVTIRCL